jgi:hypothetical protein
VQRTGRERTIVDTSIATRFRVWHLLVLPAAGAVLVLGADALPWALCALFASIGIARRYAEPFADVAAPQRQLMRLRRREEPAELLVVRVPRMKARDAAKLAGALRLTDGVSLERGAGGARIIAVLDGEDVPRGVVQQRLEELAGDATPVFGWASFPEDGITLESLVEHAERVPAGREREAGALVEPAPAMGTATS